MRLSIISDIHVLGPGENEIDRDTVAAIGVDLGPSRRQWHRFLHRVRSRFWNWQPESRHDCFLKAVQEMLAFNPDWVIANGDYGGDAGGVGLSDAATYESAAGVVTLIREIFPDRCHFVFGDHDIGKYSTLLKQGGIRLDSIRKGEELLGIHSFWSEQVEQWRLVGVNSSLLTLDFFLPEALDEEIPEWQERRARHREQIAEFFRELGADERVILFCHDPGALGTLIQMPDVQKKREQIELTVLGHLHEPRLMTLAQRMPTIPRWNPRYPVARIMSDGIRSAKEWSQFNPVVCPSPFGTGRHLSGGILFIESNAQGRLLVRRHRIKL